MNFSLSFSAFSIYWRKPESSNNENNIVTLTVLLVFKKDNQIIGFIYFKKIIKIVNHGNNICHLILQQSRVQSVFNRHVTKVCLIFKRIIIDWMIHDRP